MKSGSHLTPRWRKMDSNPRSPGHGEFRYRTAPDSAPTVIQEIRFACDSPVEGDGFEPSVPRCRADREPDPRPDRHARQPYPGAEHLRLNAPGPGAFGGT